MHTPNAFPNSELPDSLTFATTDGPPLTLDNPFRGTLVVASSGTGKTASIAAPMLAQFIRKNFAGLVYTPTGEDLLPPLANGDAAPLPAANERPARRRSLNFYDLPLSEKINPWHPQYLPTTAHAMEAAMVLLHGLGRGSACETDGFYARTALAYLTGIIWYYRSNYPDLCTIPHVVATATHPDFKHVVSMLSQDAYCLIHIRSLVEAIKQGAEKQVAGIVASLQIDLQPLTSPEITWLLTPNATDGISLNLNNPADPVVLSISAPRASSPASSAVISCVIAGALKQMSKPAQQRSFILLDEPQIKVQNLEVFTATARANKIALVYLTQGFGPLIATYGQGNAEVLKANLGNKFFGRVYTQDTATVLACLQGQEPLAEPQTPPIHQLTRGQFIGQVGGSPPTLFSVTLARPSQTIGSVSATLSPTAQQAFAEETLAAASRVQQEVAATLNSHPGTPG